jgi:hypothetical protein
LRILARPAADVAHRDPPDRGMRLEPRSKEHPMQDPRSDLTFRPHPSEPRRTRVDDAWETVVREELAKLRRRSPSAPRVVPAARRRPIPGERAAPPPAA